MDWPPAFLVNAAERERTEVNWELQRERLAAYDDIRPAMFRHGRLIAVEGLLGDNEGRFAYRLTGEDINALLHHLAVELERRPPLA